MTVRRESVSHRIDMHLKKNKSKGIAINGVPIRKASELFGVVNMVFFSPEDLQIIKDGPGERRRFLDLELCQLGKVYLVQLTNYNKILNPVSYTHLRLSCLSHLEGDILCKIFQRILTAAISG